ncbi:MAG: hypothetical protein K2L05_06025 [Muribaculaceae bacterium]|nr:hypothetical protein [Muribaculaceae bacterium]
MTENQQCNLDEIKAQIKLKSPTQQIRYISALPIPDEEAELISFIAFMRDGAMGKISRFQSIMHAYRRKYDEAYSIARSRKLSCNINHLRIKDSSVPQLVRGLLVIAAIVILIICFMKTKSSSDVNNDAIMSQREMKQLAKKYDNDRESVKASSSFEREVNLDNQNAEVEVVSNSGREQDIPEPLDLNLSGKVAGADVTMDITFDFDSKKAWGSYRYKRGSGDIVLMGSVEVTESNEYSVRYKATIYELDDAGNPFGTLELSGVHLGDIDELNGKYISVKGKESNVMLFKN